MSRSPGGVSLRADHGFLLFHQRLNFPSSFAWSHLQLFSAVSVSLSHPIYIQPVYQSFIARFCMSVGTVSEPCILVFPCLVNFYSLTGFWISQFTSALISIIGCIVYLCMTFAWMWIMIVDYPFNKYCFLILNLRVSEQFHSNSIKQT